MLEVERNRSKLLSAMRMRRVAQCVAQERLQRHRFGCYGWANVCCGRLGEPIFVKNRTKAILEELARQRRSEVMTPATDLLACARVGRASTEQDDQVVSHAEFG